MATAKKLASGNWRVRVFIGKDKNGKQIIKSFTAPTKREAERLAADFAAENRISSSPYEMTVKDALERYITAKTAVLSPSTIREYRGMQHRYYMDIGRMRVRDLTTEDMQLFISGLAMQVSGKTVANAYGLLSSSVAMFRPDAVFRVTLPPRKKKRRESPGSEEIQQLFAEAERELKLCIALSAFGSLRRGEICALKHGDVRGVTIHVHADMVLNEHDVFVYKDIPKTSESNRLVRVPQEVIDLIGGGVDDGFIVSIDPDKVTHRFMRLRDKLGMPDVRFHDLRHYYASIGAVLGIPDTYLSAFGGWSIGSGVMKTVYQNQIANAAQAYSDAMNDHFSGLIKGV